MLIKQTGFICSRRDGHPEHQNEWTIANCSILGIYRMPFGTIRTYRTTLRFVSGTIQIW